ncbi:MAG: argininosuccinate lyase, partial [Fimbriimonadaceae bacterium]
KRRGANWCPLGSAALAGTGFPIDRRMTAAELGFAGPIPNALDATSDRSFVLDALHAGASLMLSLSRIAQELVLWSGAEFGFVRLSDAVTTGSSIMPQKRNPDMAELIRGRTARSVASWVQIATMMKGLPLGYNRDTQDDKPPLFAAIRLASDSLELTATMIGSAEWNVARMRRAASSGYSVATDLADLLASRGIPFRVAHEITGEAVRMAAAAGEPALRAEWVEAACRARGIPPPDAAELKRLDPASCVRRRESEGGPGAKAMARQIGLAKKRHRSLGFSSPY